MSDWTYADDSNAEPITFESLRKAAAELEPDSPAVNRERSSGLAPDSQSPGSSGAASMMPTSVTTSVSVK